MQEELSLKPTTFELQNYTLNVQLPFMINPPIFRKSHRYQRDGHWNQKQRLKYSVFLEFFRKILEDPLQKKKIRIYEMMSDMIITRNPNQCRSHHQKMEKYRSTIPEIIASVSEKYEPSVYREHSHKYMTLIKGLLDNKEKYKRNIDNLDNPKKTNKKVVPATLPNPPKQSQQKVAFEEIEHQKSQGQEERVVELQVEGEKQDKKQLRKTAQEYSQPIGDEQGLPVMKVADREQDESESQEREEQAPAQQQGYAINSQTRFYYEQQLLAFELKHQWHAQNADQLYTQWNNQVQNIKYCEDNIKMFKLILMRPDQENPQI